MKPHLERDVGSVPGSGRSPGEGNGNPLQYSFFFSFFLFNFYFYFILLYNTVLVSPYIDMNPPWVYMRWDDFYNYLFLAALSFQCCVKALSSCGEWRPLFGAVRGLLLVVASPVAEHGF